MIIFVFSIPQLQADLLRNMKTQIFSTILMFFMIGTTIILTIITIRQKARQLSKATISIQHSEV